MSLMDPIWNKPIKEIDRALDPLGMNRVNDRMIGDVLQGITALTMRVRYYSFYVWAIDQIHKKKLATTYTEFKDTFYKMERIFMLACVAHGEKESEKNHNDVNGTSKGSEIWKKSSGQIPLNFTYFGHRLGGYGQYYEGSIINLGLIEKLDEEEFERPSELGIEVIKSFEKIVTQTQFLSIIEKNQTNKTVIEEIGDKLCLCNVKDQKSEKDALAKLFFADIGYKDKKEIQRRDSLSLILCITEQARKNNVCLYDEIFLSTCYFSEMKSDNKIIQIKIPSALSDIADKWKIIGAHDNLALTLESILQCFLQFLEENPSRGRSLQEFYKIIISDKTEKEIQKIVGKSDLKKKLLDHTLDEIIELIFSINVKNMNAVNIEQTSPHFDKKTTLASKINEQICIENMEIEFKSKKLNPHKIIANGIILVLTTAMRMFWRNYQKDKSWVWLSNLQRGDISIKEFCDQIIPRLETGDMFRDFIQWFIEKYVIKQAEEIFRGKITSNSNPKCWFHKEGANYVKDREYKARHRSIRFNSSVSILNDLNLVNSNDDILRSQKTEKKS